MSSEAVTNNQNIVVLPTQRSKLNAFTPLSKIPEQFNPNFNISTELLAQRINNMPNPTGENILLLILEIINIMPTGNEAGDLAKRLGIIYDIEKASSDLDDYYESGERNGKKQTYLNSLLFDNTEKYENTPILKATAAVLADLRKKESSKLKKYEELLQRADRIARMQLLIEASRL